jgi:hypothetical protein
MKEPICHLMKMKVAEEFMREVSEELALEKVYRQEPLLKTIQESFFNPTMVSSDTEGSYVLALGTCDQCGQHWIMQRIEYEGDDPGLYMDFIYVENEENADALVKKAKTVEDMANSDYTTFALENFRRVRCFRKPPYSKNGKGEVYDLE